MKIRKATEKDLDEIDSIYVKGVVDEVKIQFPKRTQKSILREMTKYEKERLSGFRKNYRGWKIKTMNFEFKDCKELR